MPRNKTLHRASSRTSAIRWGLREAGMPEQDIDRMYPARPTGRPRLRISDARVMAAVEEHGSYRAAAAALGVSEGMVRYRIKIAKQQ